MLEVEWLNEAPDALAVKARDDDAAALGGMLGYATTEWRVLLRVGVCGILNGLNDDGDSFGFGLGLWVTKTGKRVVGLGVDGTGDGD